MCPLAKVIRAHRPAILRLWRHNLAALIATDELDNPAWQNWMEHVLGLVCGALDHALLGIREPEPLVTPGPPPLPFGNKHSAVEQLARSLAALQGSIAEALVQAGAALSPGETQRLGGHLFALTAEHTAWLLERPWSKGGQGAALSNEQPHLGRSKLEDIELTHTLRQLSYVVDLVQIGYFDWNIVTNRLEFNRFFTRDWQLESGCNFEDAVARIDARDRERVETLVKEAMRDGTPFHADYRVVRPDGITLWIEAQGMVFYDEDDNPVRFLGTSRNISKRVEAGEAAHDEQRWFESVLNHIPLPILMVEPKTGSHVFANWAANAMRGESFDVNTDSNTYGTAFHVCDAQGRRFSASEMPTTRAARGEQLTNLEISWHTNGKVIDLLMSSVYLPASYGQDAVVICPFQDVTALKESQRALNGAINDLNLESALRDKFVSALTHDLRTPLSAAYMSAQRLERQFLGDEPTRRSVQRILRALSRVEEMIQQMLEANRIKAGHKLTIKPEDTELDLLLSDSVSELNAMHRGRIEYNNHAQGAQVHCDQGAMRRVLDNLVSNAIKYGDPQGAIRVDVADDPNALVINVNNQGPVITPDDQVNLFKPYFRAANAVEGGQTGWGIGLALVKEIAEAHGGDVSVESSVAHGTTFAITLPRVS